MTPADVWAWLEYAPAIGAVLAVILGGAWVFNKIAPVVRRVNHFLDDVLGEPARPGFESRPGLMERMQAIEHEVSYNHGTSMKDALKRVEAKLDEHVLASRPTPIVQTNIVTKEIDDGSS